MPWISEQWLAGFFDGEGCIAITVAGKQRRCILRLALTNTDHDLLREIHKQFGGQLVLKAKPAKAGWKPYGCVVWTNRQAQSLLDRIGPYIILKRRQLDLALEFLSLRTHPDRLEHFDSTGTPRQRHPYIKKILQEFLDKEATIKAQMHLLNRKGSDAIQ